MEIVKDMVGLVNQSPRIVGKIFLDWQFMLNLIHELEQSLPADYIDAQNIKTDAEAYAEGERRRADQERESARVEAASILERARQHAQALSADTEVARLAQERAAEMVHNADDYAAQVRTDAEAHAAEVRRQAAEYEETTRRSSEEYAYSILNHLRSVMVRASGSVDDGLQQLQQIMNRRA
ncbi:MAG: hypothetical protein HYU66_04350 [Armatimonadetes bacterium]|nr:hypothetical protein [Armatimonadota bacterium]